MQKFERFRLQDIRTGFYIEKFHYNRIDFISGEDRGKVITGNNDFAKGFVKAIEFMTPEKYRIIPII